MPAEEDGTVAVRGPASRGEQDTVADRRDGRARGEKLDDELLQDVALQIFAHAARAMTAGKKQAVEVFAARLLPR